MGSALAQVVLGVERPQVALLSNGEEAVKGTELTRETHEVLSSSPRHRLHRLHRGHSDRRGRCRRHRGRRLHRQHHPQADGGRVADDDGRAAQADHRDAARQAGRPAGPARVARLPRRDRPGERGRRLPAGAAPSRRRSARPLHPLRHLAGDPARRPRDVRRCGRADARGAGDGRRAEVRARRVPSRTHDPRRGADADPGPPGRRAGARPRGVEEGTNFKQDLEADSLDLYTLVQELEDSYGIQMPDEDAAKIHTVGQAVDYVLAHAPSAA